MLILRLIFELGNLYYFAAKAQLQILQKIDPHASLRPLWTGRGCPDSGHLGCSGRIMVSDDLRIYDKHHEAATRLFQKFPNVLELAAAATTGHRSLKSLQRYYNPTPIEMAASLVA